MTIQTLVLLFVTGVSALAAIAMLRATFFIVEQQQRTTVVLQRLGEFLGNGGQAHAAVRTEDHHE